jgi:hypothetical protein
MVGTASLQGHQGAGLTQQHFAMMAKCAKFHEKSIIAVKGASMAIASDIMQEVETRAGALIAKAEKPLTKAEAYSQIFKADPQLYARYRSATQTDVGNQLVITKQDGTTAPTFGAALMARQLDSLGIV